MRTGIVRMGMVLGLVAVVSACGDEDPTAARRLPPGDILRTDAVVRYSDIEGGCWTLEVGASDRFEPIGLAPEFRQDGLEVRVKLRGAENMVSICQTGSLVHVESIERK